MPNRLLQNVDYEMKWFVVSLILLDHVERKQHQNPFQDLNAECEMSDCMVDTV